MKIKVLVGIIGVMFTLAASARNNDATGMTMKVCHGAVGSWGKVLEVNDSQVNKHLSHGDYVLDASVPAGGRCEGI